jgi:hypothetical protein
VSDEQRREAGCPARPAILIQRIQATNPGWYVSWRTRNAQTTGDSDAT